MRAICDEIAPGLKLNLHMHQRAALKWMLTQERPRPAEPHPFQRTFTLQPQLHSVVLHCEIGRLSSSASTTPQLVRSDQCSFPRMQYCLIKADSLGGQIVAGLWNFGRVPAKRGRIDSNTSHCWKIAPECRLNAVRLLEALLHKVFFWGVLWSYKCRSFVIKILDSQVDLTDISAKTKQLLVM